MQLLVAIRATLKEERLKDKTQSSKQKLQATE
jgi:hypothetical protein